MTDLLKCPICDKPLQPDDLCASDIEMGACHAECLEGSPVVDLDTGEETPDAKVDTFRAREIMEPGRQQRDKFEAAVVKRLQESGFLEVEIRTECLARVGQGYQDEVINAGWHYWNEALWQNIPLVDPVLGRSPDGLDFATPDEVFDKGPEAVREWQEARGRKPETPPPSTHVRALQKLPAAFEVLDTEIGTYLTRSEQRARNSGFEYNGLYRRDSAEPGVSPHPDDLAVDRFAAAMKAKLAKKRADGRDGWEDPEQCHIDYLHQLLSEQFHERSVIDPVDIANLSMMIHERTPSNG